MSEVTLERQHKQPTIQALVSSVGDTDQIRCRLTMPPKEETRAILAEESK